MERSTGRSEIQPSDRGKAEQESKIVRRVGDSAPLNQNGVQFDARERLQFNQWWQRGEEVLRRSR